MASGSIKGITIAFNGDTTKLDKALKDVDKSTKDIDKELKQVNKDLKFNPTSVELWRQKQTLLNEKVKETTNRLNVLKDAQKQIDSGAVEVSAQEYRQLQREIIETESKLKTFKGQLKEVGNAKLTALSKQFDQISQKTRGLSMAAGAFGGALLANAYKAAQSADEIATLAKQYGVTTDEIQKMNYAQNLVDVSTESMLGSMQKMTKQMGANNSAFQELGVSITNTDGTMRDSTDVWYDTLAALGKVENETQRDILAQELFGRSAAELAGIIDDGGAALQAYGDEAEAAGVILSEDGVNAAVQFNDAMDRLKATLTGDLLQAGAALAESLVPVLEKVVGFIANLFTWFGNLQGPTQAFILVLAGLVAAISPVASIISTVLGLLAMLPPAFTAALGPIGLVIAAVTALVSAFMYAYEHSEKFRDIVNAVFTKVKEVVGTVIEFIKERMAIMLSSFTNAIEFIKSIPDRVRAIVQKIKDFIKLPHFSLTGELSLIPPSVPKISVDWYAKGGIFNSPTIAGIGEAGPEAVVPLAKLWEQMEKMNSGGVVVNVYGSDNMSVTELAAEVERRIIAAQKRRTNAWA